MRSTPVAGRGTDELLRIEDVVVRFGGLAAVDGVRFSVADGEIVGLLGPNGAGKSSLFGVVSGAVPPTSGRVSFGGNQVSGRKPHAVCRLGIARTFQIPHVFESLTVMETLCLAAATRHRGRRAVERQAKAVAARLGLTARLGESGTRLTVQEMKQLEIAKAIATQPRLVLLDEVMSGLAPSDVRELVTLVRSLRDDGMTFLVVEHNVDVMATLCDRLVVMANGRKIADGTPSAVLRTPEVLGSYLGRDRQVVDS